MKTDIQKLTMTAVIMILTACNSGSGEGSSNTTQDFSAIPQVKMANPQTCITITQGKSTLDKWWSSGEFKLFNNCQSNQVVNNIKIIINSDSYPLSTKQISLNSINGLYFGAPKWWAQPTITFTDSSFNGNKSITGTINIENNTPGYIKPGEYITISFGYKPQGQTPATFNYQLDNADEATTASINISIDTANLKEACSQIACNIPIILASQSGVVSTKIAQITGTDIGKKLQFTVNGLNSGTYLLTTTNASLPKSIGFSSSPISLPANMTISATATFEVVPTTGSISYTLVKPDSKLSHSSLNISLINQVNSSSVNQNSTFEVKYNLTNLETGNYIMQSSGFADAIQGLYYIPIARNITVTANKTYDLGKIKFSKQSKTVAVTLNVSGLNDNESMQVTITDSLNYIYNQFYVKNGSTKLKMIDGTLATFHFNRDSQYRQLDTIQASIASGTKIEIPAKNTSVIWQTNFDNYNLGLYSSNDFKNDWKVSSTSASGQGSRLHIVADNEASSKVLQVTYKANQVGGKSAMAFTSNIGGNYTHLFFQYRIKFKDNFTWVKGGKLPGLTSAPDSPTGCISNNSFDGFSARLMWKENGRLYAYIYNPDKIEECGDYYEANPQVFLKPDQWYSIAQEVQLNTPPLANGYIKQWVNGVLINNIQNLRLRNAESIYINQIKMDTFFGGSSQDWAPITDQYAYFESFMITTYP